LARERDGEGRRERTRAGDNAPEVRERLMEGTSSVESSCECSGRYASVGVAIVPIVVPDSLLSRVVSLPWLRTLLRLEPREPLPTGFR
jgi:hypothetical protein